jgi:hypothetical protein
VRLVPTTTLDGVTAITQSIATGTLTTGSPVVTGLSANTATIAGALGVAGVGIPSYTYVQSIDSASQVTLTNPATVTGPEALTFTIEPVTLWEAKKQARVQFPDEDFLMAGFIRAARLYAETALKQALLTQSWTLYLDSFPTAGGLYNPQMRQLWSSQGGLQPGIGFYPNMFMNSGGVIDIPRSPLISVNSVTYWDFNGVSQTYPPGSYNVSTGVPGRIQPQYGSFVWPIAQPRIDAVQVNFTAGYGPTAASIPDNVKAAIMCYAAHLFENREAVQQGGFVVVPMLVDALLSPADPGVYA